MMMRKTIRRIVSSTAVGLVATATAAGAPPQPAPAVEAPPAEAACPRWAQEEVPEPYRPYVGRFGLPDPYPQQKEPIGVGTAGVDFWQANHFIVYRPETAEFLYGDYSPTTVNYCPGTLPLYESLASRLTAGLHRDTEKVRAILRYLTSGGLVHPSIPPVGRQKLPPGRALDDEALLLDGQAWCNEQARCFVRLCQVSGIPARLVFLFYVNRRNGHVVAEFYADGRWAMADASWGCVFPGPDGRLLSAAECHAEGPQRAHVQRAYLQRMAQVAQLDDERLVGVRFPKVGDPARRAKRMAELADRIRAALKRGEDSPGAQLWQFGLLNYPLPRPE